MKYEGIAISDIHIDVTDVRSMYDQIVEILFNYIRTKKKLDFMIFCGDYFDHKEFLNEPGSYYAYRILDELFTLIYDEMGFDTKIRFIYGTESHECNQYDILETLTRGHDIKLIKYAEEEELFEDLHVLYLPEEHLDDSEEYYKKFLKNERKYNYIFGHGIIQEMMKEATVSQKAGGKRKRVPIFTSGMLLKMCKGQTYFGHYHINDDIDDRIFYIGSFTRWQFGEEEDKGFYSISYNSKNDEYNNEFIVNGLAPSYKTISFGYTDSIMESVDELEGKLSRIDKLVSDGIYDHVRLNFNIPNTSENPEFLIKFIKDRYKFDKKIKTNIVHGYIAEKKEKGKKVINEKLEKLQVLFDRSVSVEDKVSQFIEIEFGRKIDTQLINKYLNKPLKEILEEE